MLTKTRNDTISLFPYMLRGPWFLGYLRKLRHPKQRIDEGRLPDIASATYRYFRYIRRNWEGQISCFVPKVLHRCVKNCFSEFGLLLCQGRWLLQTKQRK